MSAKQLRPTVSLLALFIAAAVGAQARAGLDLGGMMEVGGEAERYVRALQIAGLAPLTPWSIQPFSPTQTRALLAGDRGVWHERVAPPRDSGWGLLRPEARAIANSAFPVQVGNGPTWAGRGLTGEVQAGVDASFHHVFAQLAPAAFVAQNASFDLAPNGYTDSRRFADPRFPGNIDAPQRFGSSAYARITPGTSELVVDGAGLIAGFSTAPNRWGPSKEFPLVLGPGAGGFPSVFAGSNHPWDFWLFKGHARVVYGALGQSAYSPVDTGSGTRLGSGVVLVAEPRGVPGLEVGVSRFIHREWTGLSASALERPFSGIVSGATASVNIPGENQTGSVFFRWAVPSARSEFYGELYKEDYPGAFHHASASLVENPEDYAAFTLGFQHVLRLEDGIMRVMRGELVNSETSHEQILERGFTIPLPPYIHSEELQGHTYDGLILGSPEAYGGAAWRLGIDDFTPKGRRSIALERTLHLDWLPTLTNPRGVHPDVMYDVRYEIVRFRGAKDYSLTLIPAIDLNRNLIAGHNVFNLTAAFGLHP